MEVCSHDKYDPNTILLKINGTRCNLNCVYCSEIKKDYKQSMSTKECSEIISSLPVSSEIILHGGEPLLNIHNVDAVIKAFRKERHGRKLSIQTNGYISQEIKQLLLINKDILKMGISIDGPFEKNGLRRGYFGESVFDTVDETISFLEDYNIDIKCIATVNQVSISDPIETLEYFLSHKNIKQVKFNPCFDVCGRELGKYSISPSQFLEYLLKIMEYCILNRVYKRVRIDPIQSEIISEITPATKVCMNCCKFISVYPGGEATICDALGIYKFRPKSYSTIFDDACGIFGDALHSPCMTCPDLSECGGGCTAIFRRFKEASDLIDEYCNYRKKLKHTIRTIASEVV